MSRIFCIGDIHGCASTLDALLTKEICLKKSDKVIFLGDYIDRGNDSRTVIDILLDLKCKNYDITCLMGNHEQMFIESDEDDDLYEHWILKCGGVSTLESFNVLTFDELKESYQSFFYSLPYYKILNDNYIIVHAGLNFNTADIFEDKYTMLWGRDIQVDYETLQNRGIIHGHTPQPLEKTTEQLRLIGEKKIVNIDTGCVFKHINGLGYLSALELKSMKLYSVENIEYN